MKKDNIMGYTMLFVSMLLTACAADQQEFKKLEVVEFNELLSTSEVQLVDVRTQEEVSFGVIQNAKHMDIYSPDFEENLSGLDKSKPVAVYCAVGGRSAKAVLLLKRMGFKKIYELGGGMRSWVAEGYHVAK